MRKLTQVPKEQIDQGEESDKKTRDN